MEKNAKQVKNFKIKKIESFFFFFNSTEKYYGWNVLFSFFLIVFFLAPAEVLDLTVTNDDSFDTLKVKWRRPSGGVDFYNITLSHLRSVKEVKTLQPAVTETHFDKLTPGRLYQITARTISGELFTDKMATGRTCKSSASVRTFQPMLFLSLKKVISGVKMIWILGEIR